MAARTMPLPVHPVKVQITNKAFRWMAHNDAEPTKIRDRLSPSPQPMRRGMGRGAKILLSRLGC